MEGYRRFSLLLLLISLFCNGNQNDIVFNQISTEQGLPGAYVQCIFQDSKGLMWFGIGSVGLCKYNGSNFIIYEKSDSDTNTISNNSPLSIAEDSKGNLWVGTKEGLNLFERKKGVFKRFLYSSSSNNCPPDNYIANLYIDGYDNVWIATRKGISKYNSVNNKFYNLLTGENGTDNFNKATIISDFFEDNKGNIWVGTYSNGLFLIDNETILNHTNNNNIKLSISKHWLPIDKIDPGDVNYAVNQVCRFSDNKLLLGKVDGIYLFNIKTEKFTRYNIHVNPSLNYSNISSICNDSRGMIWAGYASEGFVLIDPANNKQFYFSAQKNLTNSIHSNTIRYIFEDKSGLIWIGTKFHGLYTYDKRQEMFKNHKYNTLLNEKLGNSFVLSVMEDSFYNIWIGTKSEGIYKFNPEKEKIYNYTYANQKSSKYLIGDNRIECIIEDDFGNIYIGTENGIKKYDISSSEIRSFTLDSYFTRCMVADSNGNLWIGTNTSGIFYYNAKSGKTDRYKSIHEKEFFNNNGNGVSAITITNDTLLWISVFQNGLYKYNIKNDILTHYVNSSNDSTSISGNMVNCIFRDITGEIWIGTESNGLNIYNKISDDFFKINKVNGLPPNTINNILQDKNNNMWMASHKGLFTINNETGSYTLYNDIYGLKSNVFEVNANCITRDGLLIFGGNEGLNVFNPENVFIPNNNANLIISSVKVYDKIIAEDISDFTELSIRYNEKYISFEFALTEYSAPLKIKYKYKLENFDKDWIECRNRNYANYTSLDPGKYTFKVLAANTDNVWLEKPVAIKLTITSPLWRKPVFIIACIILTIILAIIVYIARIQFIRKNERRLRHLVLEKTNDLLELNAKLEEAKDKAEESDRLKSAFLANISHEIRTPLNGIMGFTSLLDRSDIDTKKQRFYVDIIQKSSDRMLRIINDLIDISIIESGQINLFKKPFNVNSLIIELYNFFKLAADKKEIELVYKTELPDKDSFIEADKYRISQILSNLLNNAIKVTSTGQITFGYEKKQEVFEFYVKDTGIGIHPDLITTIFKRFRQIDDTKNNKFREGSGLGLAICKALVESHGGEIWVDSIPGAGAVFYFSIPCKSGAKTLVEPISKINKLDFSVLMGIKVLIAEDDDNNFIYLKEILENHKMQVVRSENGAEAIEFIKNNTDIDIILMDMKMPVMNGLEATRIIKKKFSKIPVIMQTAFAHDDDKQKAMNSGCDNYIAKPFESEELLSMIYKYVNI